MLSRGYDSYGFDDSEQFLPLSIQNGFTYDGEKKSKSGITYTEQESFLDEHGVKEQELVAPICLCGEKPKIQLITDDDTINDRRTQN